jgi:pentatricopeptide repeat protein
MTLVTSELPLLADRELATDLAGYVIDALVDLGDIDEALRLWHGLLADERLSALEPLSRALVRGVRAVAHLDDGSSLLDLHDGLSAIRAWWDEWGDDPVRPS